LNIPVQVFRLFQPFHVYSTLQIFKILHLKLIFWTINTAEDYKRVKNVADVVITDTPDLFCLAK
jgi:spore coat polysaccharide biosynthesis protein SpsF (cytidylyltransferase family)